MVIHSCGLTGIDEYFSQQEAGNGDEVQLDDRQPQHPQTLYETADQAFHPDNEIYEAGKLEQETSTRQTRNEAELAYQFQEQWAQLQSVRPQSQVDNDFKPLTEAYGVTQSYGIPQFANGPGHSHPNEVIQTFVGGEIRVHQVPTHQAEPIDPSTFRFDSEKMRAFIQEMKNPLPQKVHTSEVPQEAPLQEAANLNLDDDDEYIPPDDLWGKSHYDD